MIFMNFKCLGLHILILLNLLCQFLDLGLELENGRVRGHLVATLV